MTNYIELPIPAIKTRTPNSTVMESALNQGLHPILARIIASRSISNKSDLKDILIQKLNMLDHPYKMADMKKAAIRVATSIIKQEYIGLETDHDCDGQTSHAIFFHNLTKHFSHPKTHIRSYIGHRLTEGYGLSESVANRILQDVPKPSLVITTDNGSSDEPRIKRLKAANINVIITDHHEIPVESYPISAYACVNPTRDNCTYNDQYIAGCMVAWLLMAATRQVLIEQNYLSENAPKLIDSLDYVAVGTIADCVNMARSLNNRIVVTFGLKQINEGIKPCWKAIKPLLHGKLTSEDLAFKIGPLLNSDGRLSSAFKSVNFLISETVLEARNLLLQLQKLNQQRKLIQRNITKQALHQAARLDKTSNLSISIFLSDGHIGVQGISASRIKDYFGKPTAIFSPRSKNHSIITGSIRGIDNFHVQKALQAIADIKPNLLKTFGGHKNAGGVTLERSDFQVFVYEFEQATKIQLKNSVLVPVIWTDGELLSKCINLKMLNTLSTLEPFGRNFEAPIFQAKARLVDLQTIGNGRHAKIILEIDTTLHQGIWFNMRQTDNEPIPVTIYKKVTVAYILKLNNFRGTKNCILHVLALIEDCELQRNPDI